MRIFAGAFVFLFVALLAAPFQAHAQFPFFQGPLVPCGNNVRVILQGDPSDPNGDIQQCITGECTTCGLVTLAQNLINFAVFLAVVVATLMFAYAGALFLFSAESPGNISKAKGIFWTVLLGIVFILIAWMVVDTVMKVLYGRDADWGPWNQILCGNTAAITDCRPVEGKRAGVVGTPPTVGGVPTGPEGGPADTDGGAPVPPPLMP